ncbi:MAG: hypothetical protein [Bacteriophage sp.]|nr:MAG: hypothetical protein [Bacteriophage sp.]
MVDIVKIDLGLDSTGRGGDSQRTAFEKCNDNAEALGGGVKVLTDNLDTLTKAATNFAAKGDNSDITSLNGLKHNIVQAADASDNMGSVTLRQLNAKFAQGSGSSSGTTHVVSDYIGAIQWFNGSRAAIPVGYVPADGQLLNRTDYPELWDTLSRSLLNIVSDKEWLNTPDKRASFSSGNGSTTFRVPDINGKQSGSLKGLFVRGDGYAASGTVNGDAIRNILGKISAAGAVAWQEATGVLEAYGATAPYADDVPNSQQLPTQLKFDASRVVPTADENRPVSANFIAIIRVNNILSVNTRQEIVTAQSNVPANGSVVSGGVLETSLSVKGSKYASASINSIKTVGVDGVGIQFNTVDFSTKTPTTRQYTLNSDSGEIFTYSNPAVGRNKLGLGTASTYNVGQDGAVIPVLNQSNVFSMPQVIRTYGGGNTNLCLENSAGWGAGGTIVTGQVYRGPLLTSSCPMWGDQQKGIRADFFIEECAGYSTQATISLKDWSQNWHYWVFKNDNNAYSSGTWISSSDKRLKTEFKVIGSDTDILKQCQSFRGYVFKRKTNNHYEAGFIAQDIEKVLPESVYVNQDITLNDGTVVKDSLSLDYGAMSAYNHECILALISKVDELTKKIESLEKKQETDAEV